MAEKKIFIFGDSFTVKDEYMNYTWTERLAKNFNVTNFSKQGYSNSHIYLSILENLDKLESGDILIVAWGDVFRFYTNDVKSKSKPEVIKNYVKHFHNEKLAKEHYKFYLDKVEELTKKAGIKLIVLWSSPSDYGPVSFDRFLYDYLDETKAEYIKTFDIDIRPALIFYSLAEIKDMNLPDHEKSRVFTEDWRPNHIMSKETHSLIYDKITKHLE